MADVPDDAVVRRIEDIMQRDRQLDRAEPGGEMAARVLTVSMRNSRSSPGERQQFAGGKRAQVGGRARSHVSSG